jgi:hypothetical protein
LQTICQPNMWPKYQGVIDRKRAIQQDRSFFEVRKRCLFPQKQRSPKSQQQ